MKRAIGLWVFVMVIGMIAGVVFLVLAADNDSSGVPASSPTSTPASVGSSSVLGPAFSPSLDEEEEKFLELINQYREAQGLTRLVVRSELTDAAYWKSQDMALEDYFSHTDSLGRDPGQLLSAFGYPEWCWRGENLSGGTPGAEYAFQLWKNSPGHNANMLSPEFTEIGISRFADPESTYRWYWATEFGGCSN